MSWAGNNHGSTHYKGGAKTPHCVLHVTAYASLRYLNVGVPRRAGPRQGAAPPDMRRRRADRMLVFHGRPEPERLLGAHRGP